MAAIRGQSLHPRSDSGLDPESDLVVFGMDEVGAGCLAGPVVGACFAYHVQAPWGAAESLPVRVFDSKKLSEARRSESVSYLKTPLEHSTHAIVEVSNQRIDEINILWARMECLWLAFVQAHAQMCEVLGRDDFLWRAFVDGNRLPRECSTWHQLDNFSKVAAKMPTLPFRMVIQGDSKVFAIAAASIIAKDYRDRLMAELGDLPIYQPYRWASNVGYPTPDHQAAIREVGFSDLHRRTFSVSGM